MTALGQVVTEGFSKEVTVQQRQRDKGCDGKSLLQVSNRRAFQAERRTSAKALKWE